MRTVEHAHERVVAHEAARQRELLPLPDRQLDATRPRGPELWVTILHDAAHPSALRFTSPDPTAEYIDPAPH